MFHIVLWAAPTTHTMDFPICIFQQVIGQMGANHTRDASNECFIFQCDLLIFVITNRSTHGIGLNPSKEELLIR